MFRLIRFFALALLLGGAAWGADDAPAAPVSAPGPRKDWTASLFASYSLFSGNSEGWSLAVQGKLSVIRRRSSLQSLYERYFGKNRAAVSVNRGKAGLTYSRSLKSNLNVSTSAAYEFDHLISLKRRVNLGAGFSLEDRRSGKRVLSLASNVLYEVTDYDRLDAAGVRSFRLLLRAAAVLDLRRTTRFDATLLYNSSFRDLTGDYRLELDTSFRAMMIEPLWIKLSFQDRYNNRVVDAVIRRNDYAVLTGLEISL